MYNNRNVFADISKKMFIAACLTYGIGLANTILPLGGFSLVLGIVSLVGTIMMLVYMRQYYNATNNNKVNQAFWLQIIGYALFAIGIIVFVSQIIGLLSNMLYYDVDSEFVVDLLINNLGSFMFAVLFFIVAGILILISTIFLIQFFKQEMVGTKVESTSTIVLVVYIVNAFSTILSSIPMLPTLLGIVANGVWIYYYYLIKTESERISLEEVVYETEEVIYEEVYEVVEPTVEEVEVVAETEVIDASEDTTEE